MNEYEIKLFDELVKILLTKMSEDFTNKSQLSSIKYCMAKIIEDSHDFAKYAMTCRNNCIEQLKNEI